eukprot:1156607-Pelagomonas_calceolata.AAC.16
MALLGWVPASDGTALPDMQQPRFVHNKSGRFESSPRHACHDAEGHGRYTDASGSVTEQYPYNPNGSPMGIAALCSENGRHLAMMPHPERCYMTWQLPWYPNELGLEPKGPAPWIKLFQNAREWCEQA